MLHLLLLLTTFTAYTAGAYLKSYDFVVAPHEQSLKHTIEPVGCPWEFVADIDITINAMNTLDNRVSAFTYGNQTTLEKKLSSHSNDMLITIIFNQGDFYNHNDYPILININYKVTCVNKEKRLSETYAMWLPCWFIFVAIVFRCI